MISLGLWVTHVLKTALTLSFGVFRAVKVPLSSAAKPSGFPRATPRVQPPTRASPRPTTELLRWIFNLKCIGPTVGTRPQPTTAGNPPEIRRPDCGGRGRSLPQPCQITMAPISIFRVTRAAFQLAKTTLEPKDLETALTTICAEISSTYLPWGFAEMFSMYVLCLVEMGFFYLVTLGFRREERYG